MRRLGCIGETTVEKCRVMREATSFKKPRRLGNFILKPFFFLKNKPCYLTRTIKAYRRTHNTDTFIHIRNEFSF